VTDHPTIQPYAGPDRTSRSRSPDSPVIFAGIRKIPQLRYFSTQVSKI
jgi:hypothetical protein